MVEAVVRGHSCGYGKGWSRRVAGAVAVCLGCGRGRPAPATALIIVLLHTLAHAPSPCQGAQTLRYGLPVPISSNFPFRRGPLPGPSLT